MVVLSLSGVPSAVGEDPARWVEELGGGDFQGRQSAARQLRDAGESARGVLQIAAKSDDLEVRSTAQRLLRELDSRLLIAELQRLREAYDPNYDYPLPAWPLFRDLCGDGPRHRDLYIRLIERRHDDMRQVADCGRVTGDYPSDEDVPAFAHEIDGLQLQRGDIEQWSLLLLLESQTPGRSYPVVSGRILAALQDPRVANGLAQSRYREPIADLLDGWMESKRPHLSLRHLLRICLVHDRQLMAQRYALEAATSAVDDVPPADRQAALLTLARIAPDQCSEILSSALRDDRTTHLWNTGGEEKQIVRTEVRDAALASLLKLWGHDPRNCGFTYLRADPLMGFRDFSIGFTDDQQRREAHRQGRQLLGAAALATRETTPSLPGLVNQPGPRKPPATEREAAR